MDISNENLVYNHRYYKTPAASPEAFMKHSHNTYELIFFEKGNVTYFIEGKRYKLKKNDLVFIRPMKFHYVDIQPDSFTAPRSASSRKFSLKPITTRLTSTKMLLPTSLRLCLKNFFTA